MIVRTEGVWKSFGRFGALKGLDLAVPKGSHFALLGANGAGKTTTIKTLMNVIQPTRGTAWVLGTDSRRLSPFELARIGYVSENQDMPPRMTVGAYLAYLRPFYPAWDRELEQEVLRRLRLPLDRRIKDLSHGMRLKTALACALPFRPELLVMDEPLSGLDPLMRDEVMESLAHWAGEATVLMSSHELAEVEEAATHVAYLEHGQLLFQESTPDLVKRFREVRATLRGSLPSNFAAPTEWLDFQAEEAVLSFVDTRYADEGELAARIAALTGEIETFDTRPMALRAIFTALARAMQDVEG